MHFGVLWLIIFSEYFGIKPTNTLHNFDHQPISAKAINWFTKSLASADIGSSLSKTRYIWKVYRFTTYSENLWFVELKFKTFLHSLEYPFKESEIFNHGFWKSIYFILWPNFVLHNTNLFIPIPMNTFYTRVYFNMGSIAKANISL